VPAKPKKKRKPAASSRNTRPRATAADTARDQLREGFDQLRTHVGEEFEQLRAQVHEECRQLCGEIDELRAEVGR
jgi:hypothetical protein